jgi:hypothetical protein
MGWAGPDAIRFVGRIADERRPPLGGAIAVIVMGALRVGGPAGVNHSDESFSVWVCCLAIKARNGALSESARTSVRLYNVRGLD